jgi:acyl-CoA thioesterase I
VLGFNISVMDLVSWSLAYDKDVMVRLITAFLAIWFMWGAAVAGTTTILALGDSLTAGYGLDPGQSLPDQLQAALRARGLDVTIINAGVSGDIAAQGAARLDWALTDDVKAVIIELGANDALRGLAPAQAEAALREILTKLKQKNLPVLLLGMKAPPNLGADYQAQFDGIYVKLATEYGAALYPFYLDGVAAQPALNQADGMHPNRAGLAIIVPKLLPYVERLVTKLP